MSDNTFHHIPVLLEEAIDALRIVKGDKYIDATAGGGGHTFEILKRGGQVLAIDRDEEAVTHLQQRFNSEVKVVQGNFSDISHIAVSNSFVGVSGVLFDLGVSSHQLKNEGRGFSFQNEEKLDMRMSKSQELSAYEVINSYTKNDLARIFMKYGEEHNASKIADAIVKKRKDTPIETTKDLVDVVMTIKGREEKIHPATRIFQAIRIEVNDELEGLRRGLRGALEIASSGGRIVVISFHSLEDRIVKKTFEDFKLEGLGEVIVKKPIEASANELSKNRRARSAKMRIFEKN